ncbi:ASCH domain-containing protein [Desulfonatronum parangueonense]
MTTDPAQIALSIRHPWVELILLGRKTIEVGSGTTRHRGPLWLHAGMTRERKRQWSETPCTLRGSIFR